MKIVNLTKPTSEELYNRVLILLYITQQWKLTLTHSLSHKERREKEEIRKGRERKRLEHPDHQKQTNSDNYLIK